MKTLFQSSFLLACWACILIGFRATAQTDPTIYVKGESCGIFSGDCFYND